jgi:hypothetical protein
LGLVPPGSGPDYEPGSKGHRKQIVELAYMAIQGLPREAAERLYDKQLTQWKDEQRREKRATRRKKGRK